VTTAKLLLVFYIDEKGMTAFTNTVMEEHKDILDS